MHRRLRLAAVAGLIWSSCRKSIPRPGTPGNRAGQRRAGGQAQFARLLGYGTVDETNATVGLARLHAGGKLDAALKRISNDLFDLGADLCTPDRHLDETREYPALRMIAAQVSRLEAEIDAMNTKLTPLRSFILPGGSALAAHLHLCRTVCRRAERLVVETATVEDVNPEAVKYRTVYPMVLRRRPDRQQRWQG